jgi:hypothetical protein
MGTAPFKPDHCAFSNLHDRTRATHMPEQTNVQNV